MTKQNGVIPSEARNLHFSLSVILDVCNRGSSVLSLAFVLSLFCLSPSSPTSFIGNPVLKVGATLLDCRNSLFFLVSILAHPERWALPSSSSVSTGLCCVSILAHPERWALRSRCRDQRVTRTRFNPRPPREVGATTPASEVIRRVDGFNPRPPREVGATIRGTNGTSSTRAFQSSPTPRGGRYRLQSLRRPGFACFNPRPPREVGATGSGPLSGAVRGVSILAHPERWALLSCVCGKQRMT